MLAVRNVDSGPGTGNGVAAEAHRWRGWVWEHVSGPVIDYSYFRAEYAWSIGGVGLERRPNTPRSHCHAQEKNKMKHAAIAAANPHLLLLGLPMRRSRLQRRALA